MARLLKNRLKIADGTAFLDPLPVFGPDPGTSKRKHNAPTDRPSNVTLQVDKAGTSNQLTVDGDERRHISTQGVPRRSGRDRAHPTNVGANTAAKILEYDSLYSPCYHACRYRYLSSPYAGSHLPFTTCMSTSYHQRLTLWRPSCG